MSHPVLMIRSAHGSMEFNKGDVYLRDMKNTRRVSCPPRHPQLT